MRKAKYVTPSKTITILVEDDFVLPEGWVESKVTAADRKIVKTKGFRDGIIVLGGVKA